MKDPTLRGVSQAEKTMVYEVHSRQNENTHASQQIYNRKRDSEDSKSKEGFQRNMSDGLGMNEDVHAYIHRKSVL